MRKFWLVVLLLCGNVALAENVRVTNPSAVSIEVGGRGMIYSLNFDRVLSDHLAAGLGIGSVTTSTTQGYGYTSQSSLVLPAYAIFYLTPDAGSFFATGGVTFVTNTSELANQKSSLGSLEFSSSPLVMTGGVGYEYRSDPGYFVRLAGYLLVSKNVAPWGGITFGYSF